MTSSKLWAQYEGAKMKSPFSKEEISIPDNEIRVVDVRPQFKGDINKFLSQNLNYPQEAMNMGIEGLVILQFVVTKEGTISNIKIKKSIGGGCDEEAKRVLLLTNNRWIPAQVNGEFVNSHMVLPVKFTLVDE